MNPANQNISELFNLQRRYLELKLPIPLFAGSRIGSSMVEQLTLNQLVEGSSPSRSTTLFYKLLESIGPQSGNETESLPDVADDRRNIPALLKKSPRTRSVRLF